MRKLKFWLAMAAACSVLMAAIVYAVGTPLTRYNFNIFDESGQDITSGLAVQVYTAGTTTAPTLYSDINGTSTTTATINVAAGGVGFYGAASTYDLVLYDTSTLTTKIKRTSVAPTTHKILFPMLGTYAQLITTVDLTSTRATVTDQTISDTLAVTGAATVAGLTTVTNATDASSLTAGSVVLSGGLAVTKQLYLGDDLDLSVSGTGVYDITLKDAVADALSIVRGSTDMIVFNTSTPLITITPATTITGALTASSTITGAKVAKALFIGVDQDTSGGGIPLVGADWNTSQGVGFYADDGGAAQTGYTETFTARYLTTAAIASGDVSVAAMHPDLTLNANYTGSGGLSAIWGNTTIKSGKTIDTSAGLGDVGGGTFGIDIVGTLAANSHACGVSVGVGGSGTKTGILTGFRIRGATGTVDWDGIMSIEDGDGSWTSMTKATASNTATMTNSPKTGNPAYWLKIYIAETAYYFPVWTD